MLNKKVSKAAKVLAKHRADLFKHEKVCEGCGQKFIAYHPSARFCSRRCYYRAYMRKYRKEKRK